MSIQSVGSSQFFSGVAARPAGSGAIATDGDRDGSGAAAAPAMSRQAQFLSQLQSLAQTNPGQAKQMLTGLATTLRSEASQAGGTDSSKAQLADRLQTAADTGDLKGLLNSSEARGSAAWSRGAAAYNQTMAVTRASM